MINLPTTKVEISQFISVRIQCILAQIPLAQSLLSQILFTIIQSKYTLMSYALKNLQNNLYHLVTSSTFVKYAYYAQIRFYFRKQEVAHLGFAQVGLIYFCTNMLYPIRVSSIYEVTVFDTEQLLVYDYDFLESYLSIILDTSVNVSILKCENGNSIRVL